MNLLTARSFDGSYRNVLGRSVYYLFSTDEDVYLEQSDMLTCDFVLEQTLPENELRVFTVSDDDFYLYEEVTSLFDLSSIQNKLKQDLMHGLIRDLQPQYEQWVAREIESESEYFTDPEYKTWYLRLLHGEFL